MPFCFCRSTFGLSLLGSRFCLPLNVSVASKAVALFCYDGPPKTWSYCHSCFIFFSVQASQDMGIDAPIPVSVKLRDVNNVFERIVRTAQHPHLSIPETEAGRNRRHYRRLVNRSLLVATGTAFFTLDIESYSILALRAHIIDEKKWYHKVVGSVET